MVCVSCTQLRISFGGVLEAPLSVVLFARQNYTHNELIPSYGGSLCEKN